MLHYTRGVAEHSVSAWSSSLNHMVHDFVDSTVSGEARLATLSPADECKAFSTASYLTYFIRVKRRYNSCKHLVRAC